MPFWGMDGRDVIFFCFGEDEESRRRLSMPEETSLRKMMAGDSRGDVRGYLMYV